MTMESHVAHSRPHGVSRQSLAAISERIRLVLRRRRALIELNDLSDHHLRDIGIDRPQIAELVKREIALERSPGLGWQRSRQPPPSADPC